MERLRAEAVAINRPPPGVITTPSKSPPPSAAPNSHSSIVPNLSSRGSVQISPAYNARNSRNIESVEPQDIDFIFGLIKNCKWVNSDFEEEDNAQVLSYSSACGDLLIGNISCDSILGKVNFAQVSCTKSIYNISNIKECLKENQELVTRIDSKTLAAPAKLNNAIIDGSN
jgi:hypothetical protein